MKKLLIALPVLVLVSACDRPEQTVATGALVGAALNEGDRVQGALIGAAAGAVFELVRKSNDPNRCLYRNISTGEEFYARCL